MTASTQLNVSRSARDIGYGVVQAITRNVSFDTVGIGSTDTVFLGVLPAGSQIMYAVVRVTTAFNAATTNVLTVGTSSGSNADIVSADDIPEGITDTVFVWTGADLAISADTPIYVKYTQTGTAASAGAATITLCYVATSNG